MEATQTPSGLKDRSLKVLLISLLLSFLIHGLTFLFTLGVDVMPFKAQEDEVETITVSLENLRVTETFQETADEAPENPSFISDRNLRTDIETSPDAVGKNVAEAGGGGQGQTRAQPERRSEPKKLETFELSDQDLVALNEQNDTVPRGAQGQMNPGFERRLERGEQLKVNATQMDYANYINRMRRKIAQVWDPQRTYTPEMNRFRSVRVDIAVVLNDEGEVAHLGIRNASLFPDYDDEALRAVELASPFPNPPDSLIQDDNRVYMPWSFTFNLSRWGAVDIE